MKRVSVFLIAVCLLLAVIPFRVLGEESIRSMIEGLPTVEAFQSMTREEQVDAYNRTQAAYDAYMALSEEEKAAIPGAEDTFESLFGYFNTLVQPIEQAQSQEEPGFGSNLIATVLAVAIALAVLPMFVKKRRGI